MARVRARAVARVRVKAMARVRARAVAMVKAKILARLGPGPKQCQELWLGTKQ